MLSYSNRQNFERIRARWELTQPGEEQSETMVSRSEKQIVQQLMRKEQQQQQQQANGASKFRRKLSSGFAFISNPLSQRKTTPGRYVKVPSLTVTKLTPGEGIGANGSLQDYDTQLLPPAVKSTVGSGSTPDKTTKSASSVSGGDQDKENTPRPFPRSRTLSFIPRPISLRALAKNNEMTTSICPVTPPPRRVPSFNAPPSKIPTPSPPPSKIRDTNSRQHLLSRTPQNAQHVPSTQASEARYNRAIITAIMRSRTTPNLTNVTNSNRPASFAVPKKTPLKKGTPSSLAEDALLQENAPVDRRIVQRRSYIQQKPLRRNSLALIENLPKRKSFGPTVAGNNKPFEHPTPQADIKRMSALSTPQTSVTARNLRLKEQVKKTDCSVVHVKNNTSLAQPRLMGPKDPPTPTPSIDFVGPVLSLSTPRSEFQRKRMGTPNGLAGVWRSSRALAASNHEVRKLPRSFTFHSFGRKEAAPPLPPIPEQYRVASLAHITKKPYSYMDLEGTRHKEDTPDIPSSGSALRVTEDNKYRFSTGSTLDSRQQEKDEFGTVKLSYDSNFSIARPSFEPSGAAIGRRSLSSVDLESYHSTDPIPRPWSIMGHSETSNADSGKFLQVKDYMPTLYWAGRFQSRFDQWRTEAMMAQLDPNYIRTDSMSECHLDQERLASCYIFGQLRDLCTSNQAADSLWEFEYKYRKDHKLLGNPLDLPNMPPFRKQDDKTSTHQGAFGRAVRKLTPRKSSLINLRNLLKGKSKGDDA